MSVFKKITLLCITSLLLFSLSSCGVVDESRESSVVSPDTEIESSVGQKDEYSDTENEEYKEGILTENSYSSDYIGVSFELPENYTLYTKEETDKLAKQMSVSEGSSSDITYEAIITNPDKNIQVIVAVDKNKNEYSAEQYLAGVKNAYKELSDIEIDDDFKDAYIGEEKFLSAEIKTSSLSFLHCVRKKGDNMIYFVITYPANDVDSIQEVMNSFKKIKS